MVFERLQCEIASRKKLNSNNSSQYTLLTSKIFGGNDQNYSAITAGLNTLRTKGFTQNQLRFGCENLNPNGTNFSMNVTFGKPVKNALTLQNSVEISYTTIIRKKPLKINFNTTSYSGSKLLGYERTDNSNTINLSLPLTKSLVLIAGATETNSSIDYYDNLTRVFGLQYNPS